MQNYRQASSGLSRIHPAQLLVELLIVIIAAIYGASVYATPDPTQRLGGVEAEYLTHTSYFMSQTLREKGYIPLWNPYLEMGDPVFENLYGYAFQPFLVYPSLIYGGALGARISVVLTAIAAGLGGWALARVLGLNIVARLFLGLILIGKGNMHSYLYSGHFGLFAMQAYFPWIFAGTIAILKDYKRWAIVTVAVGFALVFFCGTPYYPPFLVFCMGILTLVYAIDIRISRAERAIKIHWRRIANVTFSLILAALLVGVVVIPLIAHKDLLGSSTVYEDYKADTATVINFHFFNEKRDYVNGEILPGVPFSYYSYVIPFWLALLLPGLLFAICIVYYWRCRHLPPLPWRIMGTSLFFAVFFILWGAARNPLIDMGYNLIPIMTQFRHVFRLLALSSLWVGVLGAVSLNVIWTYLIDNTLWLTQNPQFRRTLAYLAGTVLIVLGSIASYDVVHQWHVSWGENFSQPELEWEDTCVKWLRDHNPGQQLSIWTMNYQNIYTYLRNKVKHGWTASDFYHVGSIPYTVYKTSLIPKLDYTVDHTVTDYTLPEYAIGHIHFYDAWLGAHGYTPIPETANEYNPGIPCLYRKEGAFSYAFSAPLPYFQTTNILPASVTTPITNYINDYDRIALVATANADWDVIAAAHEVAYPGWTVEVDGKPATLESVGGLIGVVLPRDNQQHIVVFRYLPSILFIGAIVTLITSLFCILYLLRAERLLRLFRKGSH